MEAFANAIPLTQQPMGDSRMPLQSFGCCPWCGARIELRKEGRKYACPVCACTFARDTGKWKLGIPLAVFTAVLLWIFVPVYGRIASR